MYFGCIIRKCVNIIIAALVKFRFSIFLQVLVDMNMNIYVTEL